MHRQPLMQGWSTRYLEQQSIKLRHKKQTKKLILKVPTPCLFICLGVTTVRAGLQGQTDHITPLDVKQKTTASKSPPTGVDTETCIRISRLQQQSPNHTSHQNGYPQLSAFHHSPGHSTVPGAHHLRSNTTISRGSKSEFVTAHGTERPTLG